MTKNILSQWAHLHRKLVNMSDHMLEPHGTAAWTPNTDVYESADDVMVKVELAGVSKESVSIHLENDALIITGVRRDPYGGESTAGYRFRQMEIEYGPFQCAVRVPFPVNGEAASAHLQNGILKIRLPRAKKQEPTNITVSMDQ